MFKHQCCTNAYILTSRLGQKNEKWFVSETYAKKAKRYAIYYFYFYWGKKHEVCWISVLLYFWPSFLKSQNDFYPSHNPMW